MEFRKGDKVICIKQPKNVLVDLKGKTGKIISESESSMPYIDFGKRLGGCWYVRKNRIKLYKKEAKHATTKS